MWRQTQVYSYINAEHLKKHYVLLVLSHNCRVQMNVLSAVYCDLHFVIGKFVSISNAHKPVYQD